METDHTTLKDAGIDLALLSNFVHQVVNPLNGVAGTLDNLADGVVREEYRREQRLRAARAQLEQCITLIRTLASLSQGFSRIVQTDRRVTALPQAIIESAMFYQEYGTNKDIDIRLVDRLTQNRVLGHPELIRQILMNIFDNFIKYGKYGEEVEINQWIQSKTSFAIITVKGVSKYPIRQEDLGRICELGVRGENAKQIVASGTGLGLYICKRLVEDVHGGTFHIQTAPNNGIEFTIKLPYGEAG